MTPYVPGVRAPLVLVVTMGTDYIAPARMPYELARAGLRTAVLAPADALAAHASHAERVLSFPPRPTLFEWLAILDDACRSLDPAMLLPGDDVTIRQLVQVVVAPPEGTHAAHAALRDCIVRSLGDPAGYLDSIDKARLFDAALSLGVPVAAGGCAASLPEALAIAGRIGYPLVLRPAFGSGGKGTQRCAAAADLVSAWEEIPPPEGWVPPGPPRCLVQRWIDGPVLGRAFLAWHGEEVAGATRGRIETHPAPFGPGSVTQTAHHPGVTAASQALARGLALHGFASTQWMIDPADGTPRLVEVNRRAVPATYGARWAGVDLALAFATLLRGGRWEGPREPPPGNRSRLALFPQEWRRDPESRWLQSLPSDTPWEDPALLEAMLRM